MDAEGITGQLQGLVKKRQLEVVKKVFEGVVTRTPVFTGAARASWRVSIGVPNPGRVTGGSQLAPLGRPAFSLSDIPLYAKVFISNTTPYIVPLEYGWSKQAPAGMVRITLASLKIGSSVRS
jgi:hypothetical protein